MPMRRPVPGVLFVVLAIVLAWPAAASAIRLQAVGGSHSALTQVTSAQSGDHGALYIVEQQGRVIRRGPGGSERVVLNITGRVSCCGEQGLLSIAFDPTSPRTTASTSATRTTAATRGSSGTR